MALWLGQLPLHHWMHPILWNIWAFWPDLAGLFICSVLDQEAAIQTGMWQRLIKKIHLWESCCILQCAFWNAHWVELNRKIYKWKKNPSLPRNIWQALKSVPCMQRTLVAIYSHCQNETSVFWFHWIMCISLINDKIAKALRVPIMWVVLNCVTSKTNVTFRNIGGSLIIKCKALRLRWPIY